MSDSNHIIQSLSAHVLAHRFIYNPKYYWSHVLSHKQCTSTKTCSFVSAMMMLSIPGTRNGSGRSVKRGDTELHNPFTIEIPEYVLRSWDYSQSQPNHGLFYPTGHSASDESTWHKWGANDMLSIWVELRRTISQKRCLKFAKTQLHICTEGSETSTGCQTTWIPVSVRCFELEV